MRRKHFVPAYSFAVFIFVASSIPTGKLQEFRGFNNVFDLILSEFSFHFLAFGVFTGLLCYGFLKMIKSSLPSVRIGFISFSYGLFIEIYQVILPYRSFGLDDLISDFFGIVFALIVFNTVIMKRNKKS